MITYEFTNIRKLETVDGITGLLIGMQGHDSVTGHDCYIEAKKYFDPPVASLTVDQIRVYAYEVASECGLYEWIDNNINPIVKTESENIEV